MTGDLSLKKKLMANAPEGRGSQTKTRLQCIGKQYKIQYTHELNAELDVFSTFCQITEKGP